MDRRWTTHFACRILVLFLASLHFFLSYRIPVFVLLSIAIFLSFTASGRASDRDVYITRSCASASQSTTTRSTFSLLPHESPVPVHSVGCPWPIPRKLCRKMSRNLGETLLQGTKKTTAMYPRPVSLFRLDSRRLFSERCTVPSVVCYCIASILMTVVNKVWGVFVRHP